MNVEKEVERNGVEGNEAQATEKSEEGVDDHSTYKKSHGRVHCLPGQKLCEMDENTIGGDGTYEAKGVLYASILGFLLIRKHDEVCNINRNHPVSIYSILCSTNMLRLLAWDVGL